MQHFCCLSLSFDTTKSAYLEKGLINCAEYASKEDLSIENYFVLCVFSLSFLFPTCSNMTPFVGSGIVSIEGLRRFIEFTSIIMQQKRNVAYFFLFYGGFAAALMHINI